MRGPGPNREDIEERRSTTRLFLGLCAILVAVALVVALVFGPAVAAAVEPGLGLKDAALIAFGLAIAVVIAFAFAAGDSLLGEIQYMLVGFVGMFLICWLMLAWVF